MLLTVPRRCCCGAYACRYTVQIGAEQVPRHLDCFDELANGVKGPWLDGWGGVVHRRFEAWFGKFRAIGGQVDIVMLDNFSDANMGQVQGLKQAQLDTACGNANTRLPFGLSVPYCEGTETLEAEHGHDNIDPRLAKAAKRLDRAISDVEIILKATPKDNRPLRRKLQSIHSNLVSSKRDIER